MAFKAIALLGGKSRTVVDVADAGEIVVDGTDSGEDEAQEPISQ